MEEMKVVHNFQWWYKYSNDNDNYGNFGNAIL